MNKGIINRLAKRFIMFIMLLTFPFVTGMLACSSCSGDDPANSGGNKNEEGKEIQSLRDAPYPVGAALGINSLKNKTAYRNTVIKEFGSITAENAMKMGCLSKSRDTYFWDDADYLVDFARTNDMRVHGHCLVWYKQSISSMPAWIQNFQGSKDEWKQFMRDYIHAVVGRYKGKIASWDVVNEALKDDGTFRTAEECIWTRNIGAPEYIDWAFRCAHEADPDVLLFYNDFGHEYSSAKRTAVNNLIKGMLERGVPVHGIGLQMHTHVKRDLADINIAVKTAAQTGLKIHVSELDVAANRDKDKQIVYTDELKKLQYERYMTVASAMASLPEKQRYGITMWGVGDADSYMYSNPDWPLPFDENYQRKKAYEGLINGFK